MARGSAGSSACSRMRPMGLRAKRAVSRRSSVPSEPTPCSTSILAPRSTPAETASRTTSERGSRSCTSEVLRVRKINANDVHEEEYWSPKRTIGGYGRELSVALGRKPDSNDVLERHPFDVEIQRIPAGIPSNPYHSHSAQWEFYFVLSGSGVVRDEHGRTPVMAGDAFLFKPGEAH